MFMCGRFVNITKINKLKKILDIKELMKMPFRGVRTKDRTKKVILTDRFVI